jgi:hypothetical protein
LIPPEIVATRLEWEIQPISFHFYTILLFNSNHFILVPYKGEWRAKMGVRENFQKLIDKKQQEIRALEIQMREASAYIQALQDSMKLLPRDTDGNSDSEHMLREGSTLAKTRDLLRKSAAPLPINEILKMLGRPLDAKHRVSLAGTLSGYARKRRVFTKTAPNTFGLLEFGTTDQTEEEDELPAEFGSMTQ